MEGQRWRMDERRERKRNQKWDHSFATAWGHASSRISSTLASQEAKTFRLVLGGRDAVQGPRSIQRPFGLPPRRRKTETKPLLHRGFINECRWILVICGVRNCGMASPTLTGIFWSIFRILVGIDPAHHKRQGPKGGTFFLWMQQTSMCNSQWTLIMWGLGGVRLSRNNVRSILESCTTRLHFLHVSCFSDDYRERILRALFCVTWW